MIKKNKANSPVSAEQINQAMYDVSMAPSVKYWFVPEYETETLKCARMDEPNGFIHTKSYGTTSGGKKWNSHDIAAYDDKGVLVGFLSISTSDPVGAFKITVRPDAGRMGWGQKLLDEAERSGIDLVTTAHKNSFTQAGRGLMLKWLQKKLKQK